MKIWVLTNKSKEELSIGELKKIFLLLIYEMYSFIDVFFIIKMNYNLLKMKFKNWNRCLLVVILFKSFSTGNKTIEENNRDYSEIIKKKKNIIYQIKNQKKRQLFIWRK